MEAVIIPEIHDELDTRNFEKYEEVNIIIFRIVASYWLLCYLNEDGINLLR